MGLSEDERKALESAMGEFRFLLPDETARLLLAHPDLLKALGRGQLWSALRGSFFKPEPPSEGRQAHPDAWKMLQDGRVQVSTLDFLAVVEYGCASSGAYLTSLPNIIGVHDNGFSFDSPRCRAAARARGDALVRSCKIVRFSLPASVELIRGLCALLELEQADPRTLAAFGSKHHDRFSNRNRRLAATATVAQATDGGYHYARLEQMSMGPPLTVRYDTCLMDDPEEPTFQDNLEILLVRPLSSP